VTASQKRRRRPSGPPAGGWTLGASGPTKAAWGTLAVLIMILAVYLLLTGYIGYGAVTAVIGAAAAVNLW
jgi:dolichol kinase